MAWQAQTSQFSAQHTNKNGIFPYKPFCMKVLRARKNKPKNPPINLCPVFGLYRVNIYTAAMRFGCVWAVLYHSTSLLLGKTEGLLGFQKKWLLVQESMAAGGSVFHCFLVLGLVNNFACPSASLCTFLLLALLLLLSVFLSQCCFQYCVLISTHNL